MSELFESQYLTYALIGFVAQTIDGALGMAYGVTATSCLLAAGLPPAVASATVHVAECFTTGCSGLAHRSFGNVDSALFRKMLIPGVLGAIVGAYLLSSFPGAPLKPFIAAYLLLMGIVIIRKAVMPPAARTTPNHLGPLAFFGAFVDAVGGGGWGPIVTSTLLAKGGNVRETVGSVNAVEFFVTFACSATFVMTIGVQLWPVVIGLAVGGLLAAPFGALLCSRLPVKPFMIGVGCLVIALSIRTLVMELL